MQTLTMQIGQKRVGIYLNTNQRNYSGSIWLPINHGFVRQLSSKVRGFFQTFVDLDRGVYLYTDFLTEEEDVEFHVILTRFKIANPK